MKFTVAHLRYGVAITHEPLFHNGRPCLGLCREADHQILISSTCPPGERLSVLVHELAHAWTFQFGAPEGAEEMCDLVSMICTAAFLDISRMGGIGALMRLNPGESPQGTAVRVALTRNRNCGVCGSTVAGGSVRCETTALGEVELALHCEHCDHVQVWHELATMGGTPSGTVLREAKFLRGAEATEYLSRHQAAFAC